MKALKKTITTMSREAHLLLLFALRLSALAVFAAFVLLLHRPLTGATLRAAGELYALPKGLLLLSAILCPMLEERSRLC